MSKSLTGSLTETLAKDPQFIALDNQIAQGQAGINDLLVYAWSVCDKLGLPRCGKTTVMNAKQIARGGVAVAKQNKLPVAPAYYEPPLAPSSPSLDASELQKFLRRNGKHWTVSDLADQFDVSPKVIRESLQSLKDSHALLKIEEDGVLPLREPEHATRSILSAKDYFGPVIRFGALGDTHLGSRYEDLGVLNALYDIYEQEGIQHVYHTGNFVEGESRFNKHDINVYGMDRQLQYFIEKYPQRKGITTHFIAGDDHEGWWVQKEGIDIGSHAQDLAIKAGRTDLKYLGYMEHDVVLKAKKGATILRVMHPGGGTGYAISYTTQKIVESLSGGEKPHILLIGHYHKAEYIFYRNVHCLQTGTCQWQSPFMRKKRLAAHVGGWICEAHQADDGTVPRFKQEFIPFFSKGWRYEN